MYIYMYIYIHTHTHTYIYIYKYMRDLWDILDYGKMNLHNGLES